MSLQRWPWLFSLTLASCVVEHSIVERTPSAEERLRSDTEAWCRTTCDRMAPCLEAGPCVCSGEPGEVCVCAAEPSHEECVEGCSVVLERFDGQGEDCALAGLQAMHCIDDLKSCEDFEQNSCQPDADFVPACNGGRPVCTDYSASVDGRVIDSTGAGASVGGSPGTASGSGGASSAGAGTGASAGSVPGDSELTYCELEIEACSDGATHRVSCSGVPNDLRCDCYRDARYETTYYFPATACGDALFYFNAGCGWDLVQR